MTIREAMRARLMADAAVSARVAGRIYPQRLPQGATLPALTIQLVSAPANLVQAGLSSLRHAHRYQIDCWAKTSDEAEALSAVVVGSIGATRGTWGDSNVSASLLDGEREDFDTGSGLYRRIVEILTSYSAASAA